MDIGTATVVAAMVSSVGGLLAFLLQSFRRENREDHADVISEIRWLRRVVERVEVKQDNHVVDFHQGEFDGKFKGSVRKSKGKTQIRNSA